MIASAAPRQHPLAERLFCGAGAVCAHSGPAIPMAERDHFTAHFVTTFAAALAEARPVAEKDAAVRRATAAAGHAG